MRGLATARYDNKGVCRPLHYCVMPRSRSRHALIAVSSDDPGCLVIYATRVSLEATARKDIHEPMVAEQYLTTGRTRGWSRSALLLVLIRDRKIGCAIIALNSTTATQLCCRAVGKEKARCRGAAFPLNHLSEIGPTIGVGGATPQELLPDQGVSRQSRPPIRSLNGLAGIKGSCVAVLTRHRAAALG